MNHYCNKLILIVTSVFLILFMETLQAQAVPDTIEIAFNKTTSIVVPASITSIDRGSRDVLVQKAKGVDNILQLKAARKYFPETNLTVITMDGRIHQFLVKYSEEPQQFVQTIQHPHDKQENVPLIFHSTVAEWEVKRDAAKIRKANKQTLLHASSKYKIKLSLNGIYVEGNVLYFHLDIRNKSNINYDVDMLRFFIQDKTTVKRTASQEVDIKPLFIDHPPKTIKGMKNAYAVFALEKFTIPDAKRLHIQLFEKNGGRNLSLSIRNRTIVNAKRVP